MSMIVLKDIDEDSKLTTALVYHYLESNSEKYKRDLIKDQIDLLQNYNLHPLHSHHNVDAVFVDQLFCYAAIKRNQKHPNNLKQLLGGTDYESHDSSCRRDLSVSGEISI